MSSHDDTFDGSPTATDGPRRIRPSLRARARHAARKGATLVIWIVAVLVSALLYGISPETGTVRAVAETVEFEVAPETTGRLIDLPVSVGQRVASGDLLAALDPAPLQAELDVLAAELALRNAELKAQGAAMGRSLLTEERGFAASVDEAEVDLLRARVDADAVRAELAGVRRQEQRWRKMVSQRVAARDNLDALRTRREVLVRRVQLARTTIEGLEAQLSDARGRLAAYRETLKGSGETRQAEAALAPAVAAVSVARAKIRKLEVRRKRLLLRSPLDGVVHRLRARPGDVAGPGEPIVVVRSERPERVFAYVDDTQVAGLAPGMSAEVRLRNAPQVGLSGRVLSLGAGMAPFPPQLQTSPERELWGREVVVLLDEDRDAGELVPGQIVDVAFDRQPGLQLSPPARAKAPTAAPSPATVSRPGAARPMMVPDILRRKTRVEPSALLWSPEWERFLVASDDTGYPDRDDHAPWLLLMDEQGRLETSVARVSGVSDLNDVESMAQLGDQILLLSSCSVSRRGKRPATRTLLSALRLDGPVFRASASASLVAAISAVDDPAWIAQLGLDATTDTLDARLDIEGMAAMGSDLLLGLKAPLDAQNRAILWVVDEPERLFAGDDAKGAGLRPYARVALEANEGSGVPGGISGLLALPEGGLVVLSVDAEGYTTGDTQSAGGGLWYVVPGQIPDEDGLLQARLVRRYPDARPEGVSLSRDGRNLVVVFDRGSDRPLWAQEARPKPEREGGGR